VVVKTLPKTTKTTKTNKTNKTNKTTKTGDRTNARNAIEVNRQGDSFWKDSIIQGESLYHIHIEQLNTLLQLELLKYNLPLILVLVARKEINNAIIRLNEGGNPKIIIWQNQIETMAEVIAKLVQDPTKSMVLIGATQLGKTMTVILCWIAEAVLYATTGVAYKVLFIQPGKKSLNTQMTRDLKGFNDLYDWEFSGEHVPVKPVRCHSDYRVKVGHLLHLGEEHDLPVFARTKGIKKALGQLKQVIQKAHEANVRVLLIVDECHWGMGKESIMKSILDFAKDLTTKAQGDIMLAISATPFQLSYLHSLHKVFCRTYKDYIGYAFWGGRLLDDRWPLIIPTIVSFSHASVDQIAGENFHLVDRRYFYSKKNFDKWTKKGQFTSHEHYQEFCENALVMFVNNMLVNINPRKGRGLMLRFFKKITEVKSFLIRKKNAFHKNIKLVQWNGENSSEELEVHLKNEGVTDEDLKLVMLNGNGRMGNRVTDESGICYGYDAAHSSTLTAIIQGVVGRLTGKKTIIPMIFLADQHKELLDRYVETLGADVGPKPHEHMSQANCQVRLSDSIILWGSNPQADKFYNPSTGVKMKDIGLDELESFITTFSDSRWKNKTILKGPKMTDDSKMLFWKKWNDAIPSIEKSMKLQPGDLVQFSTNELNVSPFVDSEGFSYDGTVGFRKADAKSVTNSNLKSDRLVSGTKKGYRRLQPQVHLQPVKTGRGIRWHFVAIKLRLVSDTTSLTLIEFLPNKKSLVYHPMGDQPSFLEIHHEAQGKK